MAWVTYSRGSGFYAQVKRRVSDSPPKSYTGAITEAPLGLNEIAPIPIFKDDIRSKISEYCNTKCPYDNDGFKKSKLKRKSRHVRSRHS